MLISEAVYQKAIFNEFQLQIKNSSGCKILRKNKRSAQETHKVPKMHCNSKPTDKKSCCGKRYALIRKMDNINNKLIYNNFLVKIIICCRCFENASTIHLDDPHDVPSHNITKQLTVRC